MKTKCYHCSGTTWDIISITLIYNSELKSDAKYENVLGTKYNFFFICFCMYIEIYIINCFRFVKQ